jgi:hypothetical protein
MSVTAFEWLAMALAMAAQVGVLIVTWRLLVWLVSGRNPWREPPRWLWRREAVRAARDRSRKTSKPIDRLVA